MQSILSTPGMMQFTFKKPCFCSTNKISGSKNMQHYRFSCYGLGTSDLLYWVDCYVDRSSYNNSCKQYIMTVREFHKAQVLTHHEEEGSSFLVFLDNSNCC